MHENAIWNPSSLTVTVGGKAKASKMKTQRGRGESMFRSNCYDTG